MVLVVSNLIGFGAGGSPPEWQIANGPHTEDQTVAGITGLTMRIVIGAGDLAVTGGTKIRLDTSGPTLGGSNLVTEMWCNSGSSGGDAYDFDSAPTQVFANGGDPTWYTADGAVTTTDEIDISHISGRNLVISLQMTNASYAGLSWDASYSASDSDTGFYYKSTLADLETVNASSYTKYNAFPCGINQVEFYT